MSRSRKVRMSVRIVSGLQGMTAGIAEGVRMVRKDKLMSGKKYLHKRKTIISGVLREAERWIRCEEIMPDGAVFSRDFEMEIYLSDQQIREELYEQM